MVCSLLYLTVVKLIFLLKANKFNLQIITKQKILYNKQNNLLYLLISAAPIFTMARSLDHQEVAFRKP
jgi:hypothetical protein